jgi:4-carboxymuconolactone decarboxylase
MENPQQQPDEEGPTSAQRRERGRALVGQLHGQMGHDVLNALEDVAPDFANYVFEFAFGDVYSRPGLNLKERQLVTVANLAALGNARPQLKVHLRASLNIGWTRQQLAEVLIQTAVYAGFPAGLNGLTALKEVLEEMEAEGQS